jgi:hypothetical protein
MKTSLYVLFLSLINSRPTISIIPNKISQYGFESSIWSIKNKCLYVNENREQFIKDNKFLQDKKIITISPGGYRGFYMFGICKFIKENYDLENFIFSGASAGAWLSLLLSYKGDAEYIQQIIVDKRMENLNSIPKIEKLLKHRILTNFKTEDFNLQNVFMGVTSFEKFKIENIIYTNFQDLEDAVNCCVASSHIPFITGKMRYKYKGKYSFDGGFSKCPFLDTSTPNLQIAPFFWEKVIYSSIDIQSYTTLFSRDKYNFTELINQGYQDCIDNKKHLDNVFLQEDKNTR